MKITEYLYHLDVYVASAITRAPLYSFCTYFLKVIDSFIKPVTSSMPWIGWPGSSIQKSTQITVEPISTVVWNSQVVVVVLNWVQQIIQQVIVTFCQRKTDKNLAMPWTVIRELKYEVFNIWICFLKESLFWNSSRSTEEIRLPERVTIPSLVHCLYCFIWCFKSTFL